jgi:DNA-binding transcriptional LysR family regulator
MNLRSVDLNLLTVFDAVMREGNVTRAAANIGMSQTTMSDALSRLRYLLKDDLFIRTGHGVRPTERACHFAGPIRRILDQVMATLSDAQTFDLTTSIRSFNIILRDYGEIVALSGLMHWLDSMHATISVNTQTLHHLQIPEALRSGAIDLCLTSEPFPSEDYSSAHVKTENLVCMVRRDHPTVKKVLTREQFLELNHVSMIWQDRPTPYVEQFLAEQGLERKSRMRVHSLFNMPRVVASTDMICTVPSSIAIHFAETHKLKTFPFPMGDLQIQVYLVWHKRFDPDPGHRCLRDALRGLLER